MDLVVELDPADADALRALAVREQRSVHEVVVLAVQEKLARAVRDDRLDALFDAVAVEDAELLDRLAQ